MEPIYWVLLLLAAGAVLLILEFFVPSAGTLGALSAICLIAAVIIGFTIGAGTGTIVVLTVLVYVPALLALMIKVWPYTPIGRRLFLSPPSSDQVKPYQEKETELRDYIGRTGVATTKMLPAGMVRIERKTFDAVSDGEAIEKGEKIVVRTVRMNHLVVRKAEEIREAPSVSDSADVLTRPINEFGLEELDLPGPGNETA